LHFFGILLRLLFVYPNPLKRESEVKKKEEILQVLPSRGQFSLLVSGGNASSIKSR